MTFAQAQAAVLTGASLRARQLTFDCGDIDAKMSDVIATPVQRAG